MAFPFVYFVAAASEMNELSSFGTFVTGVVGILYSRIGAFSDQSMHSRQYRRWINQ